MIVAKNVFDCLMGDLFSFWQITNWLVIENFCFHLIGMNDACVIRQRIEVGPTDELWKMGRDEDAMKTVVVVVVVKEMVFVEDGVALTQRL